ncbi:MAG TPA: NifU family protein [Nocardioidaceae bacterium]|nr:NifU family protein [Nocardioidaceae bacterium]
MAGNEVQRLAERVDTLIAEVEQSAVPAVAERVEELVRTLVQMYGIGLERAVEVLSAGQEQAREQILRRLAGDDLLAALLVLHDLHPDTVESRVQAALDGVRPYLGSHAGGVELLGVDEAAVVHLRLQGSCDGCPSSSQTVRNAIEEAIWAAAPDVTGIDVQGMVAEPPLLQIQPFRPAQAEGGWEHIDVDLPPRQTTRLLVAGDPVFLANLDGTLVAYRDRCPGCRGELSSGNLDGDLLTCAGCAGRYDVRLAGRAEQDGAAHLEPLPLLPEGAGWKVAVPAGAGVAP